MFLHRMVLENWRGVSQRELVFSAEVTLVEGPNEVGKSTIIEALHLLLNIPDDSKRQEVKAVQPVGQDLGSRVELEFSIGSQRLIYAKRYNKQRQTTLQVVQPQAEQHTGREAHDTVVQLLTTQVDLTLWNTLLVDQGAGVAQVGLQESPSLAAALDAAAGTSVHSATDDYTSLFAAVQTEYEKYFTRMQGSPKHAGLSKQVQQAQQKLVQAQQNLQQVAQDVASQEALDRQVQQQLQRQPGLEAALKQHTESLSALANLENQRKLVGQELKAQQERHKSLSAEHQERSSLQQSAQRLQVEVAAAQELAAPLQAELQAAEFQLSEQRAAIIQQRQAVQAAQQQAQQAADDEQQVQRLVTLGQCQGLLAQAGQLDTRIGLLAEQQRGLPVDPPALEKLRQAHDALSLALAKRDTAATSLTVEGLTDLQLQVDGEPLVLAEGEVHQRTLANRVQLELPGVLRLTVQPSHSVAQLQEDTVHAQQQWQTLTQRYQVADLAAAVAQQAQRAAIDTELGQLKLQQAELLQSTSVAELTQQVKLLQAQCEMYVEQRIEGVPVPVDSNVAGTAVAATAASLNQARNDLEQARTLIEDQQTALDSLKSNNASGQEKQVAQRATLAHQQQRLEAMHKVKPAEQLALELQQAQQQLAELQAKVTNLDQQWQAASPEQLQLLRDNAQSALQRAQLELAEQQQTLAVLTDRLQQNRANGKHDAAEAAQAESDALQDELAAVATRAAAAKKLWETLTRFRSEARSAYVAPLQAAIESLGSIVFGPSFTIALAEDWSIVTRTLDNKTLAFADLSIGAQEQLALLTRLAAAQMTAPEEGVPLIIDDALGFSDPSRLANMGAAIAAAGRQAQIIILTCTPGRFASVGNAQLVSLAASRP